jgi:hypothetical protein
MPGEIANEEGSLSGQTLEVTVPLAPAYAASQYVEVNQTSVTVSIPLVTGEQVTTTPEKVVGTLRNFSNPNLVATLTVWSEYEPTGNVLTLCSPDLVDSDSTCLNTYMQGGQDQTCKQHTYPSDTSPCGSNPNWNYCTSLTPGLQQAFLSSVRSAQEAIIHGARGQGLTVIIRTPVPPIPPDLAEELQLVYEDGFFKGTFDPGEDYGPGMQVHNIESTWYGEIYLQPSERFANVINSTKDPRIGGLAWRRLWETQYGQATECSSFGHPNGFPCTAPPPPPENLVGGHVITGTKAQIIPKGSKKVFIMPICAKHNANDNTFMEAVVYLQGVALRDYMGP